MSEDYYISDDFSPEFYIKLAQAGFISTTTPLRKEIYLLPEIQTQYALLDFKDLHISKKIKKLIKNENYQVTINQKLDELLFQIRNHHKDSWLSYEYKQLLKKLSTINHDNFKLISFEVSTLDNELISGEVGYIIGKTYTSLSGFFNRNFNNHGTLQLILLGKYLENNGFDFWNLGHTCPSYKLKLGAKVYKRDKFLERWIKSVNS
jgi:Leu/Phe-tRNA-protein transferase